MDKTRIFLISIFLITVIPTIYIYIEHAYEEGKASSIAKSETKKIKTFSEGLLFIAIGVGYIISTILILLFPKNKIPYLVILIGTVAIIILYYFRIYGIPIPFTDVIIRDMTTDWRDVVTKICQQILVIPISILLYIRK